MGSIKLNNLKNIEKTNSGHTYTDLHLDVEENIIPTDFVGGSVNGKDIRVSYDIDAITNSLVNIFKTSPGERFLIPTFGINLRRYLFSSVSELIARQIGNDIVRGIERWEPRVTVDNVTVVGDVDNHQYDVTITLTVIALNDAISINGTITKVDEFVVNNVNRICPT